MPNIVVDLLINSTTPLFLFWVALCYSLGCGGNSKCEFMSNSTSTGGKYNDMQGLNKEKADNSR